MLSALALTYNGQEISDGDTIQIRPFSDPEVSLTLRMLADSGAQSEQVGEPCVHVTGFELPATLDHGSTPLGCLPAGAGRSVDVVMAADAPANSSDKYDFAVSFEEGGVQEEIRFSAVVQDRVAGDTDGDMDVDFADFLNLQSNFGKEVEDGHRSADFDGSGVVDFADFLELSENFGQALAADRGEPVAELNPQGDQVPRAWTDAYVINQKAQLFVDAARGVLSNDANQFGQILSLADRLLQALSPSGIHAELVESPVAGQVTFNADGSFNYIPPPEFIGVAEFSYVPVSETRGVAQRVSITVLSEFQTNSETAVNDQYIALQDNVLVVDAADGVLKNDNAEADPLSAAIVDAPEHGSVTLDADGAFIYTPDPNYRGIDTFSYVANDQFFSSKPATVTIRVA